jgi:hypothetical protein
LGFLGFVEDFAAAAGAAIVPRLPPANFPLPFPFCSWLFHSAAATGDGSSLACQPLLM